MSTPGELPRSQAGLAPSLEAACRQWAERPAITYRGQTILYGELSEQVRSLAAAYLRLGVKPGDRVVCQLPNSPGHVVAMNAAWACGAIHVGTDNDLTGAELAWLVEHTEAAALVYQPYPGSDDPMAAVDAVARARPRTAIIVEGSSADDDQYHRLSELVHAPGSTPTEASPLVGPNDPGLVLLTSGTTGRPKGVLETLPHCWAKMQFFADAFRPGPDDVHLLYLPMAHVFGLRLGLLALLRGGRLVLLDRFSREEALRLVGQERVSVLPGMPTHLTLLLNHLDPAGHDVSSLRWAISAAASLPRTLAEQIYERLRVELLYVYGCSEGFTTLTTDRGEILRGSVGRTVFRGPPGTAPNGTVAVVDPEHRTPLPPGTVGEIAFGADHPVPYWRAPAAATNGWYYTGDLGRIDPDGCVFVLGRLNELVNRGGLKVAPTEVETALARHPAVADAAVVATPDPVLGEAICACVVPADGSPPSLHEVRTFLALGLARHKLPDELCVVEAIPRTKIGKVDRPGLAAAVLDGDRPRERLRPPPG